MYFRDMLHSTITLRNFILNTSIGESEIVGIDLYVPFLVQQSYWKIELPTIMDGRFSKFIIQERRYIDKIEIVNF